jgi:hypothetical protein
LSDEFFLALVSSVGLFSSPSTLAEKWQIGPIKNCEVAHSFSSVESSLRDENGKKLLKLLHRA